MPISCYTIMTVVHLIETVISSCCFETRLHLTYYFSLSKYLLTCHTFPAIIASQITKIHTSGSCMKFTFFFFLNYSAMQYHRTTFYCYWKCIPEFSKHYTRFIRTKKSNIFRRYNFIGIFMFQHSILQKSSNTKYEQ